MKRALCFMSCILLCSKLVTSDIILGARYVNEYDKHSKLTRRLEQEKIDNKTESQHSPPPLIPSADDNVKTTTAPKLKLQDYLRASDILQPSIAALKEKEKIEDIKRGSNLDDMDVQCKPDLLYAFGIEEKVYEPTIANSNERKYCARNTLTCCNTKHFENITGKFQQGLSQLRDRFEVMEELYILFRGPAFQNFVYELDNDKDCGHVFDDGKVTKDNLLDESYVEEKIDNMMSVLIDLEVYLKRAMWFYADFVCTICSPLNHKYFKMNAGGSKMEVHVSTCIEVMELKEFEVRMVEIFDSFISKIASFIVCKSEDSVKSFDAVDMAPVYEQKKLIEKCYQNTFNAGDPTCKKFCEKSLEKYEFPTKFFSSSGAVLKIIYEFFTGNSIDDYYMKVKNKDFAPEHLDDNIEFFNTKNDKYRAYKMSQLEWEYFSDKGVTIFSDHMSKKFTMSSGASTLAHLVVITLYGLIW